MYLCHIGSGLAHMRGVIWRAAPATATIAATTATTTTTTTTTTATTIISITQGAAPGFHPKHLV